MHSDINTHNLTLSAKIKVIGNIKSPRPKILPPKNVSKGQVITISNQIIIEVQAKLNKNHHFFNDNYNHDFIASGPPLRPATIFSDSIKGKVQNKPHTYIFCQFETYLLWAGKMTKHQK